MSGTDIGLIPDLMTEHADWGRTRISDDLCRRWDWRNHRDRPKDMAARTSLLKLEPADHIQVTVKGQLNGRAASRYRWSPVGHFQEVVKGPLNGETLKVASLEIDK